MAHILANMVKQTSLSTGATTLALSGSALPPYQDFSDVLSDGDTTEVMVVARGNGRWQAAVYSYAADVLTFVRLLSSSTGSVVSFASGLKDVEIAPLAERGKPVRRAADFTAIPSFRYDVDTTGDEVTATLPSSPGEGDEFEFNDFAGTWATNNFLVDPNGQEFEDLGDGSDPAAPLICDCPAKFALVFGAGKYRPR